TERLTTLAARLKAATTRKVIQSRQQARLPELDTRMQAAFRRLVEQKSERLKGLEQLRLSLDPDRPLNLGFARVSQKGGGLVTSPKAVHTGDVLELTFKGNAILEVTATEGATPPLTPRPAAKASPKTTVSKPSDQGSLF